MEKAIKKLLLPALFVLALFSCKKPESGLPFISFKDNVSSLQFNAEDTPKTVSLESSRTWEVQNIPDWLHVNPASGDKTTAITFTATKNEGSYRAVELVFSIKNVSGYQAKIVIKQIGADGSTGDIPKPADAIYYENCGVTDAISGNTAIAGYNKWTRQGKLPQAAVEYIGTDCDLRVTNVPRTAENYSGKPLVYMAKSTGVFDIKKINITGKEKLIFTFAYGLIYEYPKMRPLDGEAIIQASIDGITYHDLDINPGTNQDWNIAKSEFKVPSGSNELYIKFVGTDALNQNVQFRFDDFMVSEGGNGYLLGDTSAPKFRVNQRTVSVPAAGSTIQLQITSTVNWTAELASGATVTPTISTTSGNGNGTIDVVFTQNTTGSAKTATITLRPQGLPVVNVVFTQVGALVGDTKKSIAEVRTHYASSAKNPQDGWYIEGTIISNREGKNIQTYQFVITDDNDAQNSGVMVNYKFGEATHNFNYGDKVRVVLNGSKYNPHNGLLQIVDITSASATIVSSGNNVTAKVISVDDLKTGKYESQLVSINNVFVSDVSNPNLKMGDEGGNIIVESNGKSFTMRTGDTSVFKAEAVPFGVGTLTGIAGVFTNNYQIAPRTMEDYADMKNLIAARVSLGDVKLVKDTEATINNSGYIAPSGQTATEVGVYYQIGAGAETKLVAASVANPFNVILTGLTPETTYKVTAYAIINGSEVRSANKKEFTTLKAGQNPVEGLPAIWANPTTLVTQNQFNSTEDIKTAILKSEGRSIVTATGAGGYYNLPGGWDTGEKYWHIEVPIKNLQPGAKVSLKTKIGSSGTGPRDFEVQYSVNGTTFNKVEDIVVDLSSTMKIKDIQITVTEGIANGVLYIRLVKVGNVSQSGATVASGGTNRLMDLQVSLVE